MAHVVAVFNHKGGVGKTTTALALADGLLRKGRKVLFIDLDQQGNASRQYGASDEIEIITIYDILCGEDPVCTSVAIQSTESGIDIIIGDPLIAQAEVDMAALTLREVRLTDCLEQVKNDYDDVIIDCSATLGIVTTNALVASDSVVVPVLTDGYSVDGMYKVAELVRAIRSNKRLNPSLYVDGLLVCNYDSRPNIARYFKDDLEQMAKMLETKAFSTPIRRTAKVTEAQLAYQSLFDYAPSCTAAQDYQTFVEEYLSSQSGDMRDTPQGDMA